MVLLFRKEEKNRNEYKLVFKRWMFDQFCKISYNDLRINLHEVFYTPIAD
jgi:hypothetical protein